MNLFIFLFILSASASECDKEQDADTIKYYNSIIESETSRAFHYTLPTSAEAHRPLSSYTEDYGEVFDFIVVGSGTTGSVVAGRLAEIKEWKVLLLEAGGDETDFSNMPGMYYYLQGLEFNWNFNTTSQKGNCQGMINHMCPAARGKALGGTSAINGGGYIRGNKLDYDGWAAAGNKGWSFKEVLPYFIKSENSQINGDPGYHGTGGYWNVEYHKPESKQLNAFIEANQQLFNYTSTDYNGKNQLGAFHLQLTFVNGTRRSTAETFLKPVEHQRNIKILKHSYVTKLLVSPYSRSVYGVQFTHNNKLYTVRAFKEVILSAGPFGSAQILMLSGIGPKSHLRSLGIQVVQNLPVGEALQDHPAFFGMYFETNVVEPAYSRDEYIKQYLNGCGPYTLAANAQGLGFFQSSYENTPGYPDLEYEFVRSNSTGPAVKEGLKLTDEIYNGLWTKVDPQRTFNVYLMLLHPKSVGKLTLQSKDPFQYPLINPNSLTDPDDFDIKRMYEGIERIKKIIEAEPLKKINTTMIYPDFPQCRDHVKDSREYWYCILRLTTAHLYHPTGTCKMGPDPRNGAVVDHNLRVHGISRVRVADTSVIPFPTSGHPQAPAVMIGEKISDMIKRDYGKPIQPITNTI